MVELVGASRLKLGSDWGPLRAQLRVSWRQIVCSKTHGHDGLL